ncbi:MAG TPA: GNAT family N-acetyltransferase [Solirubrobacteraceae bacterium]
MPRRVARDAFLSVSAGSPHQADFEAYLDTLVAQACTRPAWWVVAADRVSRAALWSLPGAPVPSHAVLVETDWTDRELAAGRALMVDLHERASALGAGALEHTVDSPPVAPQYQEHADARVRLLEASGYELVRDGLRWRLAAPAAQQPPGPLRFRSLPEVGEEAFVDAMVATFEGTPDAELRRDVDELGPRGAARRYLLDHRALDHEPEWWELGYTGEGALAGVIMGARSPTSAVIAYVGVVPEQRGRGHAAALVRRGTERLVAAGVSEIRADCDRDNLPMVKGFERAGYARFARRRSFTGSTRR